MIRSWSAIAAMAGLSLTFQAAPPVVPAAAGTARVSGVVVDAADKHGLAKATVTIKGNELRPSVMVVADERGRFVIDRLPAGHFTITASKTAYLTSSYGQTMIGRGSGLPIAVSDGQQIEGLTIALTAGGAIDGRVVDDRGRPMQGSPVIVQRARMSGGERTLETAGKSATTDANGAYRLTGLAPGEYYVCAFPPGLYQVLDPTFFQPPSPELHEMSRAEIEWATQQLSAQNAGGSVLPRGPSAPMPASGRTVGYGTSYFPDAPTPTNAAVVKLGSGEVRGGVDITLRLQPTARFAGRFVMPDGQPAANVSVTVVIGNSAGGGPATADGAFGRSNLLPGRYTVIGRIVSSNLWGSTDITLDGTDQLDLKVPLQPTVSISGRVVFESGAGAPSIDPSTVSVSLSALFALTQSSIPVRPDGSFQVSTIMPGSYRRLSASIRGQQPASGASPSWILKSVTIAGRDVTEQPIEIPPAGASDVVITFTDRVSELSGRLTDASGAAAAGVSVVVIPTDRAMWRVGTRRLPPPQRSATDGRYRFAGLPPGSYFVVALTDVDQNDLGNDAFLEQISKGALSVTIGDGEKKTFDLRVG